jgi:hypothetical protein
LSSPGDDEVSRLYSLPLAEFTAERDALAKRLRAEGDREGASEIKGLKKPSVPAWAINQAVRSDRGAADDLVEAAERLSEAQTAAVEGGDADELRKAMAGQAAAIERMMGAVEEALEGGSRSAATLDRARETLRAVAGDGELRAQFEAGRVVRDREAVGFGGAPATPRAGGRAKKASKQKPSASPARVRNAERAEKRAARSLEAAVKTVQAAQRRLDRAQQAVDAAKKDRDEAERERAERESELADARAVVEELRE